MPISNNSETSLGVNNDVKLGKCWAALRGETAVGIISMLAPRDINFNEYREKATSCLELLGDVKSGEFIERNNERYFIQRLTLANRGAELRKAKEYLVYQSRGGNHH